MRWPHRPTTNFIDVKPLSVAKLLAEFDVPKLSVTEAFALTPGSNTVQMTWVRAPYTCEMNEREFGTMPPRIFFIFPIIETFLVGFGGLTYYIASRAILEDCALVME